MRRLWSFLLIFVLPVLAVAEPLLISVGGRSGPSKEIEQGVIAVSKDGENWEEVFTGGLVTEGFTHGNDNLIRGLAFGNGLLVAAGNIGNGVLVSTDGRQWEHAVGREENVIGMCVAFGNGMFLIPSASVFCISEDGRKWERIPTGAETQRLNGTGVWGAAGAGHVRKVVHDGQMFVFAGERRLGSTKDGRSIAWQEVLPEGSQYGKWNLVAGNGVTIFLNEKGHRISRDGITWEPLVIGEEEPSAQMSAIWTGSAFLVAGRDRIYGSVDGKKWEERKTTGEAPVLHALAGDLLAGRIYQAFVISKDGGKSWKKLPSTVPSRQLFGFDGKSLTGSGGG